MNTKWFRELQHKYGPQGVTVSTTQKGHVRLEHPEWDEPYITGGTPGDWRVPRKINSAVRRRMKAVLAKQQDDSDLELEQTGESNVIIEQPGMIEPRPPHSGEVVYHYTSTMFLPSILLDDYLESNDADVLWATTSEVGDRLSCIGPGSILEAQGNRGAGQENYRKGRTKAIRFTCNADDFRDDWRSAPQHHDVWWTVEAMESWARIFRQSTQGWRWRDEPLCIDETLIEMRGFKDSNWTPVTSFSLLELPIPGLAIRIGDYVYSVMRLKNKAGVPRFVNAPPMHFDDLPEFLDKFDALKKQIMRSDVSVTIKNFIRWNLMEGEEEDPFITKKRGP